MGSLVRGGNSGDFLFRYRVDDLGEKSFRAVNSAGLIGTADDGAVERTENLRFAGAELLRLPEKGLASIWRCLYAGELVKFSYRSFDGIEWERVAFASQQLK
jgi:hypothetical protein